MKSTAATVKDYLASLPEDRRAAIEAVRKVIRANLDKDYEECMVWGVVGFVVPHRVWPGGHHTDPGKPLMMCGVSSQKNDMVLYLTNVYGGGGPDGGGGDPALREWFEEAWAKAGKKLCVSGAGCCVRFKKTGDLALDVLGEAIRRTPAKVYMENQLKMLVGRGKLPAGKKVKAASGGRKAVKGAGGGKKAGKGMVAKKKVKRAGKGRGGE